jgi:hypothetical protein
MHKRELVVKEACHEPWEDMQGGASHRRCESCEQDVHDLSAMTRTEAKMVLARRAVGQRLCVRFAADDEGRVLFRPEPLIPASLLLRGRQVVLGAGLVVAALGGCAPAGTAVGSAASHQAAEELGGRGACSVSLEPLLPLTLQLHAKGCVPQAAAATASPPELMEVPRIPPPPPPPQPPPVAGGAEFLRPVAVQPAQKRPAPSAPKKTTARKPRREDITMGLLL